MSWVEWVAAVGGVIGAVGGTVGAVGGVRSVCAARDAARAEQRASEIADSALRLEQQRRHDDLRPPRPAALHFDLEPHPRLEGHRNLVVWVAVPRDYRVRVDAINTPKTTWQLDTPPVLNAEVSERLQIESWPPDRFNSMAKWLRFRFWPPEEVDEVEHWACPCDRPAGGATYSGPGHWEWRARVEYDDYDVMDSVA